MPTPDTIHERLLSVMGALSATTTSQGVVDAIVGATEDAIGASLGLVLLREQASDGLRLAGSHGAGHATIGAAFPRGGRATSIAKTIEGREPAWLEDREAIAGWSAELGAEPFEALVTFPLCARGRSLGALVLGFGDRSVARERRSFVATLGHAMSLALDRARLIEPLALGASAAPPAEKDAPSGDDRRWFEAILNRLPIAVLVVDTTTTNVSFVNCVADTFAGAPVPRTREALEALASEIHFADPLGVSIPYEDLPRSRVSRGETLAGFEIALHSSAGVRSFVCYSSPLPPFRGHPAEVAISFLDITDQKQTFQKARRDEERLRVALEAGGMGAWEWDIAAKRVIWSPALEDIHGIPRGSFAGTFEAYRADIHFEDRARELEAIVRSLGTQSPLRLTYRIVRPDGQMRWLETRGDLQCDERGLPMRMTGVCTDVTERKRAEDELVESEGRFRAVFDHAHEAMFLLDDDAAFVDVNPALCALLGMTREEVLGRPIHSVLDGGRTPETWALLRSEGLGRGETRLRRADGTTVEVEYTAGAEVLPGRHLAIWRDIQTRKRTERLLAFLAEAGAILASSLDHEATLRRVVDAAVPEIADCAIMDMVRPDGTLERVAVAHVDRMKVATLRELWSRSSLESREGHDISKALLTGRSEIVTASPYDLTQEPPIASIHVPLRAHGRIAGVLTLASESSGRRFGRRDVMLAEELAVRAGVAIENARSYREAQEANRMKDEFLATVSHELRTPLNAILGWASLLKGRKAMDASALQRGLETIERNAKAQARLIDEVLDVSRIIAGNLRLEFRRVDVSAVIRAAIDAVAPAAQAKEIDLRVLVEGQIAFVGDPDRLQQILWNLASNAVKFTPRNGEVVVSARGEPSSIYIEVRDTGEGIPADALPHVFDRFRQADSSTARRHGGLGLGLAIARHLVEAHGGTIQAESAGPGRGARFTVALPIRAADSERRGPTSSERNETSSSTNAAVLLGGILVLVCDDDFDARELVVEVLSASGAEVRAVGTVVEALAELQASRPDVVVSDLGMPEVDGFALIRRVRELPPSLGGATPAIALTAYASADDARRALAEGFEVHMAKPVEPAKLVAAIAAMAKR